MIINVEATDVCPACGAMVIVVDPFGTTVDYDPESAGCQSEDLIEHECAE